MRAPAIRRPIRRHDESPKMNQKNRGRTYAGAPFKASL
ncbi:hypothetical protein EBBID32_46740 [Sphingobium indicum BiD32]|uniref:Uncharacterized protein n=1 Tax=Sphingobium indicum BiD32 TaxID=1301087 RepID=N1MSZ6_9SPHN|nr:hypothetical protein EBBID32_46740 [Sphingobium indicum BiD32]